MRIASQVIGLLVTLVLESVRGAVLFEETFNSGLSNWTPSDWKKSEGKQGSWDISGGTFPGDDEEAKGLQTQDDFKFYAITTELADPVELSAPRTLVVQFSVKHEQRLMPACGGGYMKLLPTGTNQDTFSNLDPYLVNFGPDICGTATRNIVLSLGAVDKANPEETCHYTLKQKLRCETDQLTHFYTLELQADAGRWTGFRVLVDGTSKASGSLNLADSEEWALVDGKCASPQLALGSAGGSVAFIGWEIWQDKAGSIFDNILLADSVEEADDSRIAFSSVTTARENEQLQAILDKEEKFHQETTKRIQEMRAKQDAGGTVEAGDWENIEQEAAEAVAKQTAASTQIPSELRADAEAAAAESVSGKDDL